FGGGEIPSGERGGRWRGEESLASGLVPGAGERIQHRYRAGCLRDVGVVLVAAVGVVGDGSSFPQQAGGFLELLSRDPGDRLDDIGRVAAAESPVELEARMADDLAVR